MRGIIGKKEASSILFGRLKNLEYRGHDSTGIATITDGAIHLNFVADSCIGERCNLGAGTKIANLRFDDKNIKMRIKGLAVDTQRRKLGMIMGDDVKTGINVSIHPGVKIGSGAWIGAETLVRRDVDQGERRGV